MLKRLSRYKTSENRGRVSSTAIVVAALASLACGTTPLDSVVAERVVGVAGDGDGGSAPAGGGGRGGGAGTSAGRGGAGTAGLGNAGSSGSSSTCQMPLPGRYLLRDRNGLCMQKGAPDPTLPVFNALLAADCDSLDAQWDLVDVPSGVALLNTGTGYNLDVRAGVSSDGTPIVLYSPHPSANQTFVFSARTTPYYALEPQNAVQKCIEAVGTGVRLYPCDDTEPAQDFSLLRIDCR